MISKGLTDAASIEDFQIFDQGVQIRFGHLPAGHGPVQDFSICRMSVDIPARILHQRFYRVGSPLMISSPLVPILMPKSNSGRKPHIQHPGKTHTPSLAIRKMAALPLVFRGFLNDGSNQNVHRSLQFVEIFILVVLK